MVQFIRRRRERNYWKLGLARYPTGSTWATKLNAKGYLFNKSSNATRMRVHISRAERGLMSYEKRSAAELKSFCMARKLEIPKLAKLSAAKLVACLENDDEIGTTFRRFLDLPPELRLHVYEYYFEDIQLRDERQIFFGATSEVLSPPPIAQTCTLMRQETIPLFAKAFRLRISCLNSSLTEAAQVARSQYFRAIANAEYFIKAPSHLLAMPRKLEISGVMPIQGLRISVVCEIDLPMEHRPLQTLIRVSKVCFWGRGQVPLQLQQEVNSAIKKHLDNFLQAMSARSKKMALGRGDRHKILGMYTSVATSLNASLT